MNFKQNPFRLLIVRYFFVGGTAAGTDLFLFFIFAKWLGYYYLGVASASFVVATFVNYVLSVRYVFTGGVRFSRSTEIFLLYIISGAGLMLNLGLLYWFVDRVGIELMTAKVLATLCIFFWNYLLRKHVVFAKRGDAS